jgi:hypothetical protein
MKLGKELKTVEIRQSNGVKIDCSKISKTDRRLLAITFYDAVTKFYDNPENKRRFDEWSAKRAETANTTQ